jgi:hypothetical protein
LAAKSSLRPSVSGIVDRLNRLRPGQCQLFGNKKWLLFRTTAPSGYDGLS